MYLIYPFFVPHLPLPADGVNPNTRCEESDGQTPLHAAASCGSLGSVFIMQQFGGEIHAQDKNLRTPMMCAAENGHIDIVRFLLNAGAKVEDRVCTNMILIFIY